MEKQGIRQRVNGFKAWAVAAGLKKDDAPDLALIFSERRAVAAGVFTTNKVKAAPVIVSQERINRKYARAILANAGCANACTGRQGLEAARGTTDLVARHLNIPAEEILVASTGVIGQLPNMQLFEKALPGLVDKLSPDGIPHVARAIMTTDSFPKMVFYPEKAGGTAYGILGIAKGAGMIMPNMATMLSFILTDIQIDHESLRSALGDCVKSTFNRITVDGDTSTNDTVFVLANGMAGNQSPTERDLAGFREGLQFVMGELARMIVKDGEGATKVIRIEVKGAHSASDAENAARAVANSSLVKTAFYGQDPNWGRIMAGLGRAGIRMQEEEVDIWIDEVQIVGGGLGKGFEAEQKAAQKMTNREFSVVIDLHQGLFQDAIITCDLTHDYVSINAHYRT